MMSIDGFAGADGLPPRFYCFQQNQISNYSRVNVIDPTFSMWHPQAEITPENQCGIFRLSIFFQESGKLSSHLIDQGDVVVVPRRVFSCG